MTTNLPRPVDDATQRRTVETRALQMLAKGDSPKDVQAATGLTQVEIEKLRNDFPSTLPRTPRADHPITGQQPLAQAPAAGAIGDLPTRALLAHPANIRTDLGDIDELALTIAEHGILQPLLVTRDTEQRAYVLLDGHRRLAAAIQARVPRVPVIVRGHTSTSEAIAIMLVTGQQKMPLDPLDEANAYRALEQDGYSQAQIGRMVKKNQGHISQRLALLNLTPAEQKALRSGGLTLGDAYRTGRDRSTRRRVNDTHRPKPKRVLHFNSSHPLATAAGDACRKAGHEVILKLGTACGPCWEAAIRRDALSEHAIDCPSAAMTLDWNGAREQQLVQQRESA